MPKKNCRSESELILFCIEQLHALDFKSIRINLISGKYSVTAAKANDMMVAEYDLELVSAFARVLHFARVKSGWTQRDACNKDNLAFNLSHIMAQKAK